VIPEVVHDKDEFEWSRGVKEDHFKHIPSDEDNPGPVTHAYCIVRRRDGTAAVTVLTAKQIERDHRAKSKSPNSPAWTGSYEEMCKKTLVHVGLKYEPKSVELARALASEDAIERGAEIALPDVIDVPSIPGIADESAQPPSALDSLAVDDEPAQAEPPTVPATPAEPEREPGEDDDFDPTTEKDNPFLRMQHALERENAKKEAK
jgi:recombinational DNA repair protein RecT